MARSLFAAFAVVLAVAVVALCGSALCVEAVSGHHTHHSAHGHHARSLTQHHHRHLHRHRRKALEEVVPAISEESRQTQEIEWTQCFVNKNADLYPIKIHEAAKRLPDGPQDPTARFFATMGLDSTDYPAYSPCYLMRFHPIFGLSASSYYRDGKLPAGALLNLPNKPWAFMMGLHATDEPVKRLMSLLNAPLPNSNTMVGDTLFSTLLVKLFAGKLSGKKTWAHENPFALLNEEPRSLDFGLEEFFWPKEVIEKIGSSLPVFKKDASYKVSRTLVDNMASLRRCVQVLRSIGYGKFFIVRDLSKQITSTDLSYFVTVVPQSAFVNNGVHTPTTNTPQLPRVATLAGLQEFLAQNALAKYLVEMNLERPERTVSELVRVPYTTKLNGPGPRWTCSNDMLIVDPNQAGARIVRTTQPCSACENCLALLSGLSEKVQKDITDSWQFRFHAWNHINAIPAFVSVWTLFTAKLWKDNEEPYHEFVVLKETASPGKRSFSRAGSEKDLGLNFHGSAMTTVEVTGPDASKKIETQWRTTNMNEFSTQMDACDDLKPADVILFSKACKDLVRKSAEKPYAVAAPADWNDPEATQAADAVLFQGCEGVGTLRAENRDELKLARAKCLCKFFTLRRLFMNELGLFTEFLGTGKTVLEDSDNNKEENLREYLVLNDKSVTPDLSSAGAFSADLKCLPNRAFLGDDKGGTLFTEILLQLKAVGCGDGAKSCPACAAKEECAESGCVWDGSCITEEEHTERQLARAMLLGLELLVQDEDGDFVVSADEEESYYAEVGRQATDPLNQHSDWDLLYNYNVGLEFPDNGGWDDANNDRESQVAPEDLEYKPKLGTFDG
eukprot:gnl/Hemi2/15469_TR5206_c0_g2_i1.p1 gnl/Hemi2/15469_TR5206_c0_g2~~gnl/Hemi2/15469_TR5206_c0_g2_i1.p1  ORF type:complete len:843 (-),score=196.25 gnl/Hemi2/15469_TR5206_c0_g2_i1:102-2630(-)